MTLKDIERIEGEIAHFYHMRKVFLGVGWLLMGGFFTSIVLGVVIGMGRPYGVYVFSLLASLCFIAAITMFILRSAMYNGRIRNRKNLIKAAMDYKKKEQLFKDE